MQAGAEQGRRAWGDPNIGGILESLAQKLGANEVDVDLADVEYPPDELAAMRAENEWKALMTASRELLAKILPLETIVLFSDKFAEDPRMALLAEKVDDNGQMRLDDAGERTMNLRELLDGDGNESEDCDPVSEISQALEAILASLETPHESIKVLEDWEIRFLSDLRYRMEKRAASAVRSWTKALRKRTEALTETIKNLGGHDLSKGEVVQEKATQVRLQADIATLTSFLGTGVNEKFILQRIQEQIGGLKVLINLEDARINECSEDELLSISVRKFKCLNFWVTIGLDENKTLCILLRNENPDYTTG
jgi:hypothetical protein